MKPLPVSEDAPPRQLGRFELVAELASGGMATVYLGRLGGAGGFQRFVAIKRLHSHLANDAEFVDMFLDEARLAARLHHPNVVPILEIGTSDRGYYLVMEYVEGETLARLLNLSHQAGSPVPIQVTVRIFLDVLAGLHAAHELVGDDGRPLDIVHRDVSPQNVLVAAEGTAKITDFGVAHAADRLAHTRTGQLKGKFSYMAPEQALGYTVDRRADVFAIGTCLWEALACKRLFKGDTEADTIEKVLRGPIPRLRSLVPSIHPALEEVVGRALERDRDRRFPSTAHFADALERAAVAAGVLGAQRDVAAHVQRVLGPLLLQQREAIRAWISGMEQRGGDLDMQATRGPGPLTRVDVPRGSRRDSPPPPAAGVVAGGSPLAPMVDAPPPSALPPSVGVVSQPAPSVAADSSVSAMSAVERSAAPAPQRGSSAATFAIVSVVLAVGVFVGVSRAQSSNEEAHEAKAAAPHAAGASAATPSSTVPSIAALSQPAAPTATNPLRAAPPPVPTTPIGTPLTTQPSAAPSPLALAATTATTPAAPPAAAPRSVPNYAVGELPTSQRPRASAPPPRSSPPRSRLEPAEPAPRRESPRGERSGGGDDDIDRNPYR